MSKNVKTNESVVTGKLVSYTSRWNPFSNDISAVVKIGDDTRKIPIDSRQREFLQKEYPPGSSVALGYNGTWRIISRSSSSDFRPIEDEIPFFDQ